VTQTAETVGILHPGSMGAPVAGCAAVNASAVLWCPTGRSAATAARADRHGLEPVAELHELLARADVLISLCPPAAAEDVACQVAEPGFAGVFVEGNAISPARVERIASLLPRDCAVVDAAVIGSPPVGGKSPTLYLAGPAHATGIIEELFAGTAVRTQVLGGEPGQASALKLSYTSFQKVSRVLAALALGAAHEHGVDQELLAIARTRSGTYLAEPEYVAKTASRAWRWDPELQEAADMLAAAGLPDEVLRAAAAALERWHDSKDDQELTLDIALARLARQ
jgi:3-hydroxyisobutyrate dehydrogenase-like beta-hydroxyacid dehydrogenase